MSLGQVAQKLIDVKISVAGKTASLLLWNGLLSLLGAAAPVVSWMSPIWNFFMDRMFSWAIEEGILGLNLIGISMTVNAQVKAYLKAYRDGEAVDKNPNATKEMKNAAINKLFDASVDLWNTRKLQSDERRQT